jgi:hypothetical protein
MLRSFDANFMHGLTCLQSHLTDQEQYTKQMSKKIHAFVGDRWESNRRRTPGSTLKNTREYRCFGAANVAAFSGVLTST